MASKPDCIVLTGFGPFPGARDNVSSVFASRLALLAGRRLKSHRVIARKLPTEWEAAPAKLMRLIKRERPALVLHFGVSWRVRGFVIETTARNAQAPLPDAIGALPASAQVVAGGPEVLRCKIPCSMILDRLEEAGLPAEVSDDAGAYLCNAILYRSLAFAIAGEQPFRAGFIHLPVALPPPGQMGRAPALDWDGALQGGFEIIRTCLGRPRSRRLGGRRELA